VKLVEELENKGWAHRAHAHLRYWFRGQTKAEAGWSLTPKVYREDFGPVGMTSEERFKKECQLNQDFRVMSAGLRRGGEEPVDLYFLQQHYGMPTRLLDWTNNPLAALYFACSGDWSDVGEVFMMDVYQLPQPEDKGLQGIATSGRKEIQDAIEVISSWGGAGAEPTRIIAVRPDYFDRRISLQRGCFTLHGPDHQTLTPDQNPTLTSVKIASDHHKQKILRQLTLLGVDHFSIYGDLE